MPAPLTTTLLAVGFVFAICGIVPAAAAFAVVALLLQLVLFFLAGTDGLGA